jgi:hypothetical protein
VQLGVLETAIRAAFTRLGAGLLEDLLALDPGYRGPAIACGAGHLARFVSYRDKVTDTVLGPVTVRRAYYHCRECGHGVVPRDRELGTERASLSPGLRSMTAHAATAVPFAKATALLEEMAGVSLTVKRAERSAEADGAAARAAAEAESAAILARKVIPARPRGPLPGILYIEVDGTGVPMTPAETAGRPGKGDDGRAHTREVKLACLFTQTTTDKEGRPVQDRALPVTWPPSPPPKSSARSPPPRPSAAAPGTSASSPSSATARNGSGTSLPPASPRPPRSSTSTTPASTCTTSPLTSPSSSPTLMNGAPDGSPSSTPATSRPSARPPAPTPSSG